MEFSLDAAEVDVLRESLEKERKELLLEIAHTDHRPLREELKLREELLEGILEKLAPQAAMTEAGAA
jgi:hypothetical protein